MYDERIKVIKNIGAAVSDGDSFRRVELHDKVVTAEDVRRVILPFDIERKKLGSKISAFLARHMAESETKKRNAETKIVGLENALSVTGGAIVTQNHFNFMDSTISRLLAMKCGRAKKFDIIIQEENVFMTGYFGFLMRNCNTLPLSRSAEYMAGKLKPAISRRISEGHFILIYPEEQMWFNYKKPRAMRDGAYHMAATLGVPIIPTFVTMEEIEDELDPDGFYEIRHTLHVMPPIYPDPEKTVRENRKEMCERDYLAKRECYERTYGIKLDESFIPGRDIAGYVI